MPVDTVLLQRCGYERPALIELLDRFAPLLQIPDSLQGKSVLLKPNLISSRGPSWACTDPRFIAAVAGWFRERGAAVAVGDSPAFGSAADVLRRLGVFRELQRMGVRVVNFATPVPFTLAGDVEVGLAAEAFACDLFINLPKLKAHDQMYVTLAVKNIYGIVKGLRKSLLHMQCRNSPDRFAEIILDLLPLLPPNVTLLDGIEAMHVAGPLQGEPIAVGCVAGSRNPLAVDTALLNALELPPENSPLWRTARARKCRGAIFSEIDFPLLHAYSFHGSGFRAPAELAPIRFSPLRFLRGVFRRILLALRR